MPRASKRPSKTPSKTPAKPRAKRSVKASSPSSKPFLRFYYSESLRAKTLAVLTALEKAKDSTKYRDDLSNVVVELTDSGMDYYFLKALKFADAGFFVQQSANFGMLAATSLLASFTRNFISRMDSPQLLKLCSYIRQLMK